MTIIRFRSIVCSFVSVGMVWSTVSATEPPESQKGYYEKRISIVEFPSIAKPSEVLSPESSLSSVMQSLRMTGLSYAGMPPSHLDEATRVLRSQGYNAVIGGGHRYLFNDDPNAKMTPNLACGGSYEQLLRDARNATDACHRHGLKFFLHQTSTMVDATLIAAHPEWSAIDLITGKPHQNGYGTSNTCLNNEEFMSEYFRRLEKLLVESGADGLLPDEIQFFGPTLCGCPSCRNRFQKETDQTIPPPESVRAWLYQFSGKTSYAAWLEWRRKRVTETLKKIRTLVNKANPEGVVINYLCNPTPSAPYYMAGYAIDDFHEHSSVVGYECEPPRMQSLYYSPLIVAEMKYLRAVAENMQTGTFRLAYSSSPGEHLWDWCLTRSQGFGSWWLIRDQPSNKVALPLIGWDARFEAIDRTLESAAEVGVLFSLDARDRNVVPADPKTGWLRGYLSTCGALSAGHVPYKAIIDRDLAQGSLYRKVKTLILFNNSSMCEAAIEAVRSFVKDGGTLVASSGASLLDEHGRPRTDFGLADVFGFSHAGERTGPAELMIPERSDVTGVVVGTLPHEHPFVSLKNVAHNVNVVGQMVEPDGTRHPGLVTRTFGRGRVIYFCGHPESKYQFWSHGDSPIEPGRLWTDNRNSNYGQLICAAALAGGSPPMRVENLPEGVLAETYKHENRDLKGVQVRLANLEGGRMKTDIVPVWYGIEFPDLKPRLPQPDQPIRVTVRAIGVRNVYLVSPDYESIVRLAPKQSGDQVTVTLPNVHRYSMLYFEQAGDLLKTLGTTASKSIPAARSLVMEESVPLVGAFVPGSSTAFAGSEEMHGGSEPSIYLGEMSRFIYGSQTTNTKVGMTLKIADTIPNPILEIGGMEAAAPIKILLNGKVVYEGSNTFVADRWTTKTFPIPANTLTTGDNSVEIQNTGHGPVSAVPWFGVSYVRLRSEQK